MTESELEQHPCRSVLVVVPIPNGEWCVESGSLYHMDEPGLDYWISQLDRREGHELDRRWPLHVDRLYFDPIFKCLVMGDGSSPDPHDPQALRLKHELDVLEETLATARRRLELFRTAQTELKTQRQAAWDRRERALWLIVPAVICLITCLAIPHWTGILAAVGLAACVARAVRHLVAARRIETAMVDIPDPTPEFHDAQARRDAQALALFKLRVPDLKRAAEC